MNMILKTARTTAIGAALGASLLATTVSAQELRGWNIHVEDYPVSIGMESFVAEVSEKTDGRVTGKVFHNGVLGDQPDAIEQARLGAIDFGVFSLGPMGQVVPETNVVSLPFIFKSTDQMYRLMDGDVGDEIGKGLEAKGLVALGWYDAGARSFYNSIKPINTPEDVVGMKVRVMNNDLFVGMVESMGGNATPMAFGEVYQSLRTGVVDGAENNPPSYESTNHYEVAKYYSLSEHLIIPECLCMSKATWDRFSPEDQEIVMAAGRASADLQRGLWQEREAASMAKVEAAGTIVNRVENKVPFQEAMAGVYASFLEDNPDLEGLVKMIRDAD
ncbi:MAG: TRAP transporter substrate-binding protein [Jannaschia helgolandensis]|jgi:tripartite ATP-independent transporter DctP family solute receptor|uniref:Tripartite ATP-independent transporter solute receptor, DctP family n=1 Tax=Jannaschia helgolandensis TaxID=188906 RepID=A0A1H7I2E4_9RHOB|nr:TRAP transporter substrate-binding protein [Jannaschia helgolandensis]SEK56012.1 tripartite ATP-independent transporter solute receptor, DctP family [Jannaschia helgolandensis]|tara:strand:- start:3148 stop:4140 length:993 start_codon:yes stop_codon:yes gene_type:complete